MVGAIGGLVGGIAKTSVTLLTAPLPKGNTAKPAARVTPRASAPGTPLSGRSLGPTPRAAAPPASARPLETGAGAAAPAPAAATPVPGSSVAPRAVKRTAAKGKGNGLPLPLMLLVGAAVGLVGYQSTRKEVFYEIQEGDTLCDIAGCYNVHYWDIFEKNK